MSIGFLICVELKARNRSDVRDSLEELSEESGVGEGHGQLPVNAFSISVD
jgi:hypothetical protein